MSPHGTKNSNRKAMSKIVSITHNGPRMSSKKKRKLANENSDPEVLDSSDKYWRAIKRDSLNEKILKHLSAPSRRYKLKDEESILPAKKKRKLLKNGGLESDSDEKNSKKEHLEMQKKLKSKLRKLKKQNLDSELAPMSGVKNKSKKSSYEDACTKGKKSRQKISANYDDQGGVCIYELGEPELKNKTRKKLMAERLKGANHLLNKKKVRVGKEVLTPKNLTKKQKPTLRVDAAKFQLLPRNQQERLHKKFCLKLISDAEGSDSDSSPDKDISDGSCKKSLPKMARSKWADLNKKTKLKMQELESPKSKKSKRQQVSEEDEDDSEDDNDDDDVSSEEEDLSDDDIPEEEEDDDKDEEDEEDEEEDDDEDEDSSDELTNDEKSRQDLKLSNGDWENVNEEPNQDVIQDAAYGNGWKPQEGEKPSSSNLLPSWSQNNGINANNTYHHLDPLVSQQQQPHQLMQAGNMPALTMSRPMTNSSNLLPPFGVVVDTAASQQHYPNQVQDSSMQALQQQPPSYNVYGGVDYSQQVPTSSATRSQSLHLQQQLHQSQTHPYSGFNHLQSQQNNSSNVQRVKHYYPAYIGKSGIIEVEESLRPVPPEEVLTTGFRISIKRCDMATLVGSNWLNDEIINFYMNLIVQRGKTEGFNSVYIPSTFFFPMVMKRGYNGVRRWTKNVDIFDHDLMLIPIHLEMENHWTLIAVDFLQSSICYYDSYLQDKDEAMDAILEYLKEEMRSKKNIDMDVNCWVKVNMKNIPLQENLSDCGVFSCIYAEYISRGAQMDFTQEDMPYFRRKMVYEILHHKITVNSPRDTENLISDDLIQDMGPATNDMPNLEPPVSLENGLPDSLLNQTSNDNSMKVNEENAGLTGNTKELKDEDGEISKDSDALQSSSGIEDEEKISEDHQKKYSSEIAAEMKRIANVFEEANAKEQEVLLNRLRNLQKSYSRILKQKTKHKHKAGHKSLKDLISRKGDSETDNSDVSITSSTTSTSSSSSSSCSSSSSSTSGSSEQETDDTNMSSSSDSHDQVKLSHITWEVEKLLMSFTDVVRSIGKASNRYAVRQRLLDPSGSFSVIKGIDYISSELQNISNHYNQMLVNESPKKTAVKRQVSRSPSNAMKMQQKQVLKCIAPQLSVGRKNIRRKVLKRLHTRKALNTTKANVIPKKVASGYGEFYQAESIDRQLLSSLVKDAGGRLLNSPPYTRKVQIQESLLTKFPLPDGIFDLTGSPSENSRKQQAHRNLLRSDHGKRGKKKK